MLFLQLPEELLLQIFSSLDYAGLVAISATNSFFHHITQDHAIWRSIHESTFSPARQILAEGDWKSSCATRIESLREFLIRGTNDYHAASARTIFTEMSHENGLLLYRLLEMSDHSIPSLLVLCQGYVLSNVRRLLPRLRSTVITEYYDAHRDRLQADPRSQVFLLRMLLARHTGYQMSVDAVETFLKGSHLITYQSIDHPLYFFPPIVKDYATQGDGKILRSGREYDGTPHVGHGNTSEEQNGPVVNWGVVETINSLIKLYRDRMGEAIPGFIKSRDDYEAEVPMCSSMFDADLSGNWRGLYGYLDFRELDALDASRAFSPDFFDGIQSLRIGHELPFDDSAHPHEHGEHVEFTAIVPGDAESAHLSQSESDDSSLGLDDDIDSDLEAEKEGQAIRRKRFIADGHSIHGGFHIHGSTMQIPDMEPGFKIVKFDDMYNGEGLMPWVMNGVYVPSIGIIGRWRDRTEPVGEGVEGPYCLWRDRVQDLRDQEEAIEAFEKAIDLGRTPGTRPEVCKLRYLKRQQTDMSYIIIEEKGR